MTVVLVCTIPFEQFLRERVAKYQYTWRGRIQQVIRNSAHLPGNRTLENAKITSQQLRAPQAWTRKLREQNDCLFVN
ncbi:hypothetical protein M513_11968 [Trichuris suis]|uniref:Uncharacterized protein n=1 Tax=Trichuris suis TaxID=68888 RepID=A0A085LQB3_9BILA|nr:hypothetical protein M513_11968 [Trichuris suis]